MMYHDICPISHDLVGMRVEQTPNDKPPAKHRSHDEKMQYVANVITAITGVGGIVGGVIAYFAGQILWVIPLVAALIFMFFALCNRKWRLAGLSLLVIAFVALTGAITYSLQNGKPATAAQSSAANTTSSTTPPSRTATTSASASSSAATSSSANGKRPRVLVDNDTITLKRYQAIDVDQPGQEAKDSSGATGALDLYFSAQGLPGRIVAHDSESVFVPPRDLDHYTACADQFDPHASDRNLEYGIGAYEGSGFCFKTSDSHMAWAGVAGVEQPVQSAAATAVMLHVIVWDELLQ